NDISDPEFGFNSDYNRVALLTRDKEINLPENSKTQLAQEIIEYISKALSTENTRS
ncbi:MAG: phosphopantothenoylcysteine decarboxylase/phosphopantothenate--cysteine ligase, partial [Cellvibrionaceae bacterium]